MIKFELPMVAMYEKKEKILMITFRVPEHSNIVLNEFAANENRCALSFHNSDDYWIINSDYEAVNEIIEEAIKKEEML